MKIIVIIAIAVGVGVSASVGVFLNSEFSVIKSDCDIHKEQIFKMGNRFQEIRKLQEEISPGTDYNTLDQEFQELTDQALEKRNWYIANCLE